MQVGIAGASSGVLRPVLSGAREEGRFVGPGAEGGIKAWPNDTEARARADTGAVHDQHSVL